MEDIFENLYTKNLLESFDLITSLEKSKSFTIEYENHIFNGRKIKINPTNGYFKFKMEIPIKPGIQTNLEMALHDDEIIALKSRKNKVYINTNSFSVNQIDYSSGYTKILTGKISGISSVPNYNNEDDSFMRLMIPTTKDTIKNLFESIENSKFTYKTIQRRKISNEILKVNINNVDFDAYLVNDDARDYLVIDCLQRISLKLFNKIAYNILLGIGFISGNLILDKGYYFSFVSQELSNINYYHVQNLIDSIITHQPIITVNPYSLITDEKLANLKRDEHGMILEEENKLLYKNMRKIDNRIFSDLCNDLFNIDKMQASVFNYLSSINESPIGSISKYFVVLESLSSVITDNRIEKSNKLNPITNVDKADLLKSMLTKVLDVFISEHYPEKENLNANILYQRINTINNQPNMDKLVKSFELVNYNLSNNEKRIVGLRNIFLHGSSIKTLDDASKLEELYHIKSVLKTLIATLVLKYYGYQGKIVNYAFVLNSYTKRADNDEPFILI